MLYAVLSRWFANLVQPNSRLTPDRRAQKAAATKVARPLAAIGGIGVIIGLVMIIAELLG